MLNILEQHGGQDILDANPNPTADTAPIYNMDTSNLGPMVEEEIGLNIAHKIRMLVVNNMTKGGKTMPADPKEVKVLLAAVDGMDRQSISRMRIKSDNKMADAAQAAIALADEIFSDRDALIARARRGDLPPVDNQVELANDFVPIPGQDQINPPQESFEDFRVRMNLR